MDVATLGTRLKDLLALTWSPVAIAFRDRAPDGVARIGRSAPASCSYWALAAGGDVFATEAADHLSCPVGAHTHGVPMDEATGKQLGELVQIMVKLEYLAADEVSAIPTRKGRFGVAIYAPLAVAPVEPDVVVVRGNARQVMLLAEAARSAGVVSDGGVMGRPACSMLPLAMQSGQGQTSLGCIGNRVYTEATDDELYFTVPGSALAKVIDRLAVIVAANHTLEQFHRERRDRA